MSEHVIVSIMCNDAKITRLRGIPPAVEFLNLELPASQHKSQRALVGPVPRVTLDANIVHRDPQKPIYASQKSKARLDAGSYSRISAKGRLHHNTCDLGSPSSNDSRTSAL